MKAQRCAARAQQQRRFAPWNATATLATLAPKIPALSIAVFVVHIKIVYRCDDLVYLVD
jgi:hypothetical protein